MTRSILAAALIVLAPFAAFAHARLEPATPAADPTVHTLPTGIAIGVTVTAADR